MFCQSWCLDNLGHTTKFTVHSLRVLTNADVNTEAEQSLKRINNKINPFSKFEEQTSLEKSELNNSSMMILHFPM